MKYQLKNILSNYFDEVMHNILIIQNSSNEDNNIRDIYDSILYKKAVGFLKNKLCAQNHEFKHKLILTYNFNTDDAPIFHSSKTSFWPLQLLINELPVKLRFQNLILFSMWMGPSEPTARFMNFYMSYFVKQAKSLMYDGFAFMHKGKRFQIFLIPICSSVDSVV